MEEEIKKAKETISKLEKTLKETQDNLDNLRESVLKSCDAALNILRGTESYEENGLPKDFTDKFKIEDEGGL